MLGGVLTEILVLYRQRHRRTKFDKNNYYWIMTVLMIISGGFITLIYSKSGFTLQPLIAVHIGASAPYIIGNLKNVNDIDLSNPLV
jgi:hypothetical protein